MATTLPAPVTSTGGDLVLDATFAASDGVVYFLTECCGASATGTTRGTACRGCYRPLDDRFGMAWMADTFEAEYPAWCLRNGLTEGTPNVFANYARRIADQLGVAR